MISLLFCGCAFGIARRFARGVNIISRGAGSNVGERCLDFARGTA
jgi:hypothetical protein